MGDVQKLKEMIEDQKTAMLTTSHEDSSLRSRPMMVRLYEDGVLWFFTNLDGQKADALYEDSPVNISFSDVSGGKFISLSANAKIILDPKKNHELWNPLDKAWFAGGENDPNLALIKAHVTGAEYWDAKMGLMVTIFGYAKSMFTGEDYSGAEKVPFSENKKVSGQEIRQSH